MEAQSSAPNKIGKRSLGDLLSTRGGSVAVAVGAAILAGILLFVFVQRYKDNSTSANAPTAVFVARGMIPQGTSADLIASQQLVQRTTMKYSQVQAGAIVDPRVLHGEAAAVNIYPGQQITLADFTPAISVNTDLTTDQRAEAIPVDAVHGLIGFVRAGDHVDVLASYGGGGGGGSHAVATLLQDILVLSASGGAAGGGVGGSGGSNGGEIVLRVPTSAAPQVAYAADNGKLWVTLRPPPPATGSSQAGSTGATTTPAGH